MGLKGKLMMSLFVSMTLASILLVFVCARAEAATQTPAEQTPALKPQYGGVLKIIDSAVALKSFGYPPDMTPYDWYCTNPVLESLLLYPEKGAIPKPLLANSWKYSPDYKSLTLTLRKGVKFHDGTDFNAQAVKSNLTQNKATRAELNSVASIDVVDDHTVRLNLSQYSNVLLKHLSGIPGYMISPAALEKNDKNWAWTHPVGTGPFKFVSYQRDVALKYAKFDGYWEKNKPYLDGVESIFISDPTVARMSFERGEAHVLQPSIKDARDFASKGYQVTTFPTIGYQLGGDSKNPDSVFANKKVREAIEYAIDKEAIVQALGYGFWEVANQFCYRTFVGYNPNIKGRPYNPARAKQLLAEAGYPNGFKTRLIVRTGPEMDAWVAVQRYLKDVGIDADMDVADMGRHMATVYEGWKNSILLMPMTPSDPNYDVYQTVLVSTRKMFVSIQRPPGWDALLARTLATVDDASITARAQELTKMVYDEAMLAPLVWELKPAVKQKSVHDDKILAYSRYKWTPANAWLSK